MAQTSEGAAKVRATKAGVSLGRLVELESAGNKWCYKCRAWKTREDFAGDRSRYDGLTSTCKNCRSEASRKPIEEHKPKINPLTGKPGPSPNPFRDGDKTQARQQVTLRVRNGEIPPANGLPCAWCNHTCEDDSPNHVHEYHHHRGYDAAHFLDVIPLCRTCHGQATSDEYHTCRRGHAMQGDNVGIAATGRRFCRECRRIRERGRKDASYWRNYRLKRKAS